MAEENPDTPEEEDAIPFSPSWHGTTGKGSQKKPSAWPW